MIKKNRKKRERKPDFVVKDKISWLDSRGGRTMADVEKDELGEFVWMGSGKFGKYLKVYIPKTFEINKMKP